MKRTTRWALVLTLLIAGAASFHARADERPSPALRFNPFVRPDLDGAQASSGRSPAAPAWSPVLKATLLAGNDSMANLGGVVLKQGEQTHGYRLREVRVREAVFAVDDELIVLSVDPHEVQ